MKHSDSTEATEKIREDCCPGTPYIVFTVHPSVSVTLINPQPQSGHFTHILNVRDGDNITQLAAQLTRVDRLIKGKKFVLQVNMTLFAVFEYTVMILTLCMINKVTISCRNNHFGMYSN